MYYLCLLLLADRMDFAPVHRQALIPREDGLKVGYRGCELRDGSLLMIDYVDMDLKHYSAKGEFLGRFGGRGEGPGEFRTPTAVRADERFVYVMDTAASSIHLFSSSDFKFVKKLHTVNGRNLVVSPEHIYVVTAVAGERKCLIAYNKSGKEQFSSVPIPKITLDNRNFLSDVAIDQDRKGHLYLIHEMAYSIIKTDAQGKELKRFQKLSPSYTPPPQKPFTKKFSKELTRKWMNSFSRCQRLLVLDPLDMVLVSYTQAQSDNHFYDLYTTEGQPLSSGLKFPGELICDTQAGQLIFVEERQDRLFLVRYGLKSAR